jgi:D-sedoheptulose 7-phosphate isomerase
MSNMDSIDCIAGPLHFGTYGNGFQSYFGDTARVLPHLPYVEIEEAANQLYRAYQEGRRVFLFGNGGSASLASHFACDLGKGTADAGNREKRFRVLSLTDNTALLTAWANDTSYEQVFAEQLRNFIQYGDVAFAISGSGSSRNVLLALQAARQAGSINIGLTGFKGGKMKELCDVCIVIPSDNMQIIEDFHLSTAHALFTVVRHRIMNAAIDKDASTVQRTGLPAA